MRAADLQLDFHADSAGLERSIVGRVRFIAVAIKTIGLMKADKGKLLSDISKILRK